MDLIRRIEILERIHILILRKRTGRPYQLAQKIGVSERTLFNYIDMMKSMNAPIEYCKIKERYFYSYQVEFHIGFVKKISKL